LLLTGLNGNYETDYLSDPFTAGTIEAVSVARIVVFTVVCGKPVTFAWRSSIPQIYMKPTFHEE
jgi:hypothetical protein